MNAPFPLPAEGHRLKEPEVWEPFNVQTDYVDGVSTIRVLPDGSGHMIWWRHHLNIEGDIERVVAARMVMPREVMRLVALRMLSESMLDEHRIAEKRRKMD